MRHLTTTIGYVIPFVLEPLNKKKVAFIRYQLHADFLFSAGSIPRPLGRFLARMPLSLIPRRSAAGKFIMFRNLHLSKTIIRYHQIKVQVFEHFLLIWSIF